MKQESIFDLIFKKFKITKPIRLIELFGGYGSQHLALKYLKAKVEHWKLCEWAVKSIQAYYDAHSYEDTNDYSKDMNKDEIVDYLFSKGISMDYNEPMTLVQIKRQKEEWCRKVYNNIIATKNTVDVQQTHSSDLEIVDIDKYTYMMTYSFPCQDLSLAGLGKGMSRDSGTRSGMLWQVERILDECTNLPQILLMENVPQVKGTENVGNFNEWQSKLESLGYKNYHENLIATDYEIPQTRNRTFMISILGDYSYSFPEKIPLKLRLKDMLEDNVDEKYYLSDRMINFFTNNEIKQKEAGNGFKWNVSDGDCIAKTVTTINGSRMDDNFVKVNKALQETLSKHKKIKNGSFVDSYNKNIRDDDMAGTITTRVSDSNNTFIAIKEATKQGYAIAHDGDSINLEQPNSNTRRGRVGKGVAQTLMTNPQQAIVYGIATNESKEWQKEPLEEMSRTLLANKSNSGVGVIDQLRIRKLTPRECFRLMGVRDEDYERIAKNQSDASLYHLAGDSIVVNVLMAIFKELL